MTSKIFKNSLLAVLIAVFACTAVLLSVLFEYFMLKMKNEAENFTSLAASVLENGDAASLCVPEGKRVYLISVDGVVLFDSRGEEETQKVFAEEVEIVLKDGKAGFSDKAYGASERTVRYGLKTETGSVVFTETTEPTMWLVVLGMSGIILAVVAVGGILTFAMSVKTSRTIAKTLNSVEPEKSVRIQGYGELSPLFGKIERQNKMIQKQVEELSRQRREFNEIIDNMSEGLIIIDDKKQILSINSAALKLLNTEMPMFGAGIYSLGQGELFYDAVDEAVSGENSVKTISDGANAYQVIATPVFTDAEVTGAVMVIIDNTEREKLETMRREFTSNVSHELKTPLTSIYGLSEILMNDGVETEIVKDFAKSINDETGRMITLVNDILKLSQLDEGGLDYSREHVDLLELSYSVVDRLKTTAKKADVTISVQGERVTVFGVHKVLEEIVYNLCDNGIKYNIPGGSVTVAVGKSDEGIYLSVSDTGIGIPEEALPRIFERFYRVDKSHSRKIGGTGLGLSIVKHAAAMHGAVVAAESTQGKGTVITVRF